MSNRYHWHLVVLLSGLMTTACDSKKSDSDTTTPQSATETKGTETQKNSEIPVASDTAAADKGDSKAPGASDAPAVDKANSTAPGAGDTTAVVGMDAAPEAHGGEEAHKDIPFESDYVGKHKLGVNRVNDGKRTGAGEIFREANALVLTAEVENGKYRLAVNGIVKPVSKTEFVLEGMLRGVPNLEFAGKPAMEVTTEGSFTFRSTKGRKYWRLYDVDGEECVCGEGCGNEFCYIDLSF